MLSCQRFARHVFYGTGFGGTGGPFFAAGWFLIGVLVTYMAIGGLDKKTPSIIQQQPIDSHYRDVEMNRPDNHEKHDRKHFVNIIDNEKFNDNETMTIAGITVNNNKTLAGTAEDLLAQIHTGNNEDVAGLLAKSIRVLCMVLTTAKYHRERAVFVRDTWGRRCTHLVFLSDIEDPDLPSIKASAQTDWGHVWSKVRGGFRWAYDNHLNDFDWFMKADDDTYFIMENLRALLVEFNPDNGVFVGHEFGNPSWRHPRSYYSGGSGYILSRHAVIKLVEGAFPMPKYCSSGRFDVPEDVEMGRCLEYVSISTTDTRDDVGRQRFLPLPPNNHLTVGYSPSDFWIWTYDKYPYKEGKECCSSLAISFHYITPLDMVQIEYLVHRVHLFGRNLFYGGGDDLVGTKQRAAFRLVHDKLIANKYDDEHAANESHRYQRQKVKKSSSSLPSEDDLNKKTIYLEAMSSTEEQADVTVSTTARKSSTTTTEFETHYQNNSTSRKRENNLLKSNSSSKST